MVNSNQQYLYIVQWGEKRSICRFYQWNNENTGKLLIINNEEIANFDDLGLVIN